jgi:hypothetical protein
VPFIAHPPAINGADRDEAAYRAIEPHLALLIHDASGSGWRETEVAAAMVAFALDRTIEAAGPQAVEQFLSAMLARLRRADC